MLKYIDTKIYTFIFICCQHFLYRRTFKLCTNIRNIKCEEMFKKKFVTKLNLLVIYYYTKQAKIA